MSGFNTYDECVEWSKECIGSQEIWIFEDQDGVFHPISLVYGQKHSNTMYTQLNGFPVVECLLNSKSLQCGLVEQYQMSERIKKHYGVK